MSRSPSLLDTTIVQAGAGTGKTESLANRIIELAQIIYERKKSVPRFVATTFTERATSELRERVVSLLSRRDDAEDWLSHFVQDTEDLHISTIHGTLSLILHRFGSLLGLDPEFVILNEADERDYISRVLRDTFSKNVHLAVLLEQYPFSDLINIMRSLTSHRRLHGKDFRGATGWEKILERERVQLIEALQSLQLTNTSELPPKLSEKVRELSALLHPVTEAAQDYEKIRRLFLGVVGEMSKPALREGARGCELKPALDFIFSLKQDNWGTETYSPIINQRHDDLVSLFDELVSLTSKAIQEIKKEAGVLTFDDLEFLTLELITAHPEVLYSIRSEWDYWFVDEFQDTSPLQKKLLFQFLRTPWNAYFVGDPQQSIYLFRGADENVFQETKAVIQKNEGTLDRLGVNYRSHPDLLTFLNHLFSTLRVPMETLEARGQGVGEIRTQIHLAGEKVDEDLLVLQQIHQWRHQGYGFHDMAVLVRTNDRARAVAKTLGSAGVPVYIHSSGGYYDRREVLDALALLSFIEDPSDDDTFVIIARSPWVAVPDPLLAQWGLEKGKRSFWESIAEDLPKLESLANLKLLKEAVVMAETRPLSTVFEHLIERLGFLEFCLTGDASGRREANLRKLLWKLRNAESTVGFSAAHFIEMAWRELNEIGEESEAASFVEPQRVNVMTIHMSKGLKFNCVIVPHCGNALKPKTTLLETAPDGRWAVRVLAPDSEEKVSPLMHVALREERFQRELAEAIRVFYVGVTRAAERLSLISSESFEKDSWFSHLGLNLGECKRNDEGLYSVTRWEESPVVPGMGDSEQGLTKGLIKLPGPLNHLVTNLTVTRLVQNRFREKGVSRKNHSGSGSTIFEFQLETQQRGQAIHSIFEEYKYNPQLGIKKLCELARARFPARLGIDERLVERALEIKVPPLRELIENGQTEWGFMFRERGLTLEGKIDLWGMAGGDTWIVDYKSAESFTQESIEKVKEQLELYALAINRLGHPWEKIKLAVVAPLQRENAQVISLSPRAEILERLQPLSSQNWVDYGDLNI